MISYDEHLMHMPSGRRMLLRVPTPLTVEDKAWLHALIDLILVSEAVSTPEIEPATPAAQEATDAH